MRRPILLIAILAVTLALAGVAAAAASTTDQIIHDCLHSPTGGLTGTYPRAALKQALHNLPGDAAEYSSCHDAIYQALLDSAANPPGPGGGDGGNGTTNGGGGGGGGGGALGGGTGGGGSGTTGPSSGGTVPVAVPKNTGSRAPVTLDGSAVQPGAIPAIGRDAHSLPTPLLVFLVLLGIGALAPAATTIGRRVIARRRA